MTTGLTNELSFRFDRFANGFTVRDLRVPHRAVHFEFPQHTINDDLQMQLAHTGDDRLSRFRIRMHPEGRILFRQTLQSNAHLLLIVLCLGLHRY